MEEEEAFLVGRKGERATCFGTRNMFARGDLCVDVREREDVDACVEVYTLDDGDV